MIACIGCYKLRTTEWHFIQEIVHCSVCLYQYIISLLDSLICLRRGSWDTHDSLNPLLVLWSFTSEVIVDIDSGYQFVKLFSQPLAITWFGMSPKPLVAPKSNLRNTKGAASYNKKNLSSHFKDYSIQKATFKVRYAIDYTSNKMYICMN